MTTRETPAIATDLLMRTYSNFDHLSEEQIHTNVTRQKKRIVCIIWGRVNRNKDEFTQMLPA